MLTAAAGDTVLQLANGSLEGVDVRLPSAAAGTGIEAASAQLRDVRVSGPGDAGGATGIDALGNIALDGVTVSGTGTTGVTARDLAFDADDLRTDRVATGLDVGDNAQVHVTGARLRARDAAVSTRGTTFVTRSLLETTGANAVGVDTRGGGLTLDHDTVAGAGEAALDVHLVDLDGRANISAVALAGHARGIRRDTSETGGSYPIAIRDSVWDTSRDVREPGDFTESGNAHVAPALTADLHPRGSSAQVDRDSRSDGRYVDLDGIAALGRADAGAFEYRRRAPSIDAADVPAAGIGGAALSFAVTASDADGVDLQAVWTFGDGAIGTGARTAHAYAAPGIYTVALRVSDEAGLTATRSFTVAVASTPAPATVPAPPAVTPPAPDRVVPKLTALKLTSARGKAKLRFVLTEPATVRIAVAHRAAIVRRFVAGAHALTLRAPGRAKLTITATDAAGNRSAPRSLKARS